MLHVINKAPNNSTALMDCLNIVQSGSGMHALLLIEDAVYLMLAQAENETILDDIRKLGLSCYVLQEDLKARGLGTELAPGFILTDYAGFVDLTVEHDKIQSWS